MSVFQIVLPQLTVSDIGYPVTLEDIAEDLQKNVEHYVFVENNAFVSRLRDGGTVEIEDEQSVMLVDKRGSRHFVADTTFYWVRSSNGKRCLTEDSAVADGYFDAVPAELLLPSQGTKVSIGC